MLRISEAQIDALDRQAAERLRVDIGTGLLSMFPDIFAEPGREGLPPGASRLGASGKAIVEGSIAAGQALGFRDSRQLGLFAVLRLIEQHFVSPYWRIIDCHVQETNSHPADRLTLVGTLIRNLTETEADYRQVYAIWLHAQEVFAS